MRRSALALLLAALLTLSAYADGPRTQSSVALIAPTPAITTNNNQIATTAYVQNVLNAGIPLASGKVFIGSAGNLATPQTPSGDCTISIPGVITCTQAAGNFNIIGNLTVGGSIIDGNGILATNIAAPATPAAGTTRIYIDSTTKTLSAKNDASTVSNTVVASLAVANQFMTGISAAGVITRAQPAFTDVSGSLATTQLPAFSGGDVTSSAGSAVLAIGTNKVTRAMEAQGVARSVIGVTGNATANVADIQGTANQFLGVNSAGTALAFLTMSGDATLSGGAITVTKINGVDPLAAWAAYTPTVSCNAGTITTQSQSFRFKNEGKTTRVMGTHTITTVGTCTGTITYSLPSSLTSNNSGPALAVNSGSGALVVALLTAASANFQLFGTPTNTTYQFNFEYENQ